MIQVELRDGRDGGGAANRNVQSAIWSREGRADQQGRCGVGDQGSRAQDAQRRSRDRRSGLDCDVWSDLNRPSGPEHRRRRGGHIRIDSKADRTGDQNEPRAGRHQRLVDFDAADIAARHRNLAAGVRPQAGLDGPGVRVDARGGVDGPRRPVDRGHFRVCVVAGGIAIQDHAEAVGLVARIAEVGLHPRGDHMTAQIDDAVSRHRGDILGGVDLDPGPRVRRAVMGEVRRALAAVEGMLVDQANAASGRRDAAGVRL